MTVTPVLADQLEDRGRGGAAARLPASSTGSGRPRPTSPRCRAECRPACEAERGRYRARARAARRGSAATRCAPSSEAAATGRVALDRLGRDPRGAAACSRPARGGGCRSTPGSARTGAASAGPAASGCPSAPTPRASSALSPSTASRWFCVDQSAHRRAARRAGARSRTEAGPVGAADRLGGGAAGSGRSTATPPTPPTPSSHGKSLRGMRLWKVGGGAYDPARGRGARAARRRASSSPPPRRGCARYRDERGRRGLLVFAIDTELLGHWWSEGPIWLREVLAGRRAGGVRLLTLPAGARRARAERARRCAASSWGEGKDLRDLGLARRSPTSPGRARRLELRLLRALSARACAAPAAMRAARELLARAVERLGLPRPPRPGGRLRLPARHRPRRGAARGHRLRRAQPTRACATSPRTSASRRCSSPEPAAR